MISLETGLIDAKFASMQIGDVNFLTQNLRHRELEESSFGDNNDLQRALPALFLTTWVMSIEDNMSQQQ